MSVIRVFQVATGNVGTEMIRRIASHPDLELAGLHCYSPEKVGRDAGELVGLEPNGVIATGTVEEIVAAKPDVLTFHGVFPDEDLYVKVLEAGIDIVTTADWITGHHRDQNHPPPSGRPTTEVLQQACERGGSTFYGTGMNPGLTQILGVIHSCDVAEIENVTVIESVDVSCHHSVDSWEMVGYGLPVGDPSIPALLEKGTRVFADGVYLMADCFGLELDDVTFSYELGACTEDIDLGWYRLPKGSLGANYLKYQGIVGGVPKVEVHVEWQMTPKTEPHWNVKGCYITKIQGDPCVYSKHMVIPKPGTDFTDPAAFASVGMTVTGLPALNAIRSVIDAPPGILTSADLPLRGFAGRFK
ncbi:Putative dihydrodipicolinate reductase [Mycobacteroides abscessus]|uniref:NAD(P)H-dependent amine dehydrogenase family protein n=1 Tax=Mycobacteroides abscessus TaxID=36809 RepID=UPI0005E8B94E|nr:dihydrodipicolinate reductase [Mycobacteroides abscessus]CPU57297.1 Putative dihydrodipicolinate reductase [Mycobacteroides abscessus]